MEGGLIDGEDGRRAATTDTTVSTTDSVDALPASDDPRIIVDLSEHRIVLTDKDIVLVSLVLLLAADAVITGAEVLSR